MQLGSRTLDGQSEPYVIAEVGVNHEGSIDLAHRLIDLAKQGGAHAAKFQTYKAARLASRYSPAYWDTTKEPTTSQFELFQKYDAFEPRDYQELAAHCREVGIDFVSTPFDDQAVEVLDPLVPFFKIASADITNVPLLRSVASTGKPVLMSTGASTLEEVDAALAVLSHAGCRAVGLLHCILNYPTSRDCAHLGMIADLKRRYPKHVIGYSDHVVPDTTMSVLTTAYLLGAVVIEKHFTHDKTLPGNDHYHSMDVGDLGELMRRLDDIRTLVGSGTKTPVASEGPARLHARRSIVATRTIAAGETLTAAALTTKRPGSGISPLHWDLVIGHRTRRRIEVDRAIDWADLNGK